ncbi:hypothetical protein KIN20_014717 [Parelaphostrongylus tenuis]|uniref:Uncharacterized protein n=1 Tax=Parelaphostrongylus tenuis TaxID=148309 RepID=A0AAD5MWI9_PARTN|nr:hypothetical protein KIN20_014717 [Parelaphostrongylus tenuis]
MHKTVTCEKIENTDEEIIAEWSKKVPSLKSSSSNNDRMSSRKLEDKVREANRLMRTVYTRYLRDYYENRHIHGTKEPSRSGLSNDFQKSIQSPSADPNRANEAIQAWKMILILLQQNNRKDSEESNIILNSYNLNCVTASAGNIWK